MVNLKVKDLHLASDGTLLIEWASIHMPPYFRRVKRFARRYQTLTRQKIRLAVMVYHAPSQMADATWTHGAEELET